MSHVASAVVGQVSVKGLIQSDSLHLRKPKRQVESVGHSCCEVEHVSESDRHKSKD